MTASVSNPPQIRVRVRNVPKASPFQRSMLSLRRTLGGTLKFTGKAAGLFAAINIAGYTYEYYTVHQFFEEQYTTDTDGDGNEVQKSVKKVLVVPFDNLKLVEEHSSGGFNAGSFMNRRGKQPTITLEVKEFVNVIHKAASDSNVSALYADFGEGMRYPLQYAHIEEVRNAIRIFNESHRVHRSPNVDHNPLFAMSRNSDPKLSMAFGHNFGWGEYFLASSFSQICLQPRGYLDLSGAVSGHVFLGGMLDKYGIKAHVFKHGDFKNAPNSLTERGYTKPHLKNVKSTTSSLNDTVRSCIQNSRALNFDEAMWKSVSDYGNITATNAKEIGLVDSLTAVSPLNCMVNAIKDSKKAKPKLEDKFGPEICANNFSACQKVSVAQYKRMVDKRARLERIHSAIDSKLSRLSELSTATSLLLSSFGIQPSGFSKEKIAVITVNGSIDSSMSFKVIQSIQSISDDKEVKCLVLRVDSGGGSVVSSEAILEELKLLDIPIVCSMGNAAASGGYYIATNSNKIFAQPTTLTGSIGVFLIKFDATKFAKSYGIRSDFHPRGSHSAAPSPLAPLTKQTEDNLARISLSFYDYFKKIVADSRSLTVDQVENLAQGRVWTGEQAKEIGLVDELGGLDRAMMYAKSTYTKSDNVSVEYWPKNTFSLEDLPSLLLSGSKSTIPSSALQASFSDETFDRLSIEISLDTLTKSALFAEKPYFMLAMDEKTAIDLIVMGE